MPVDGAHTWWGGQTKGTKKKQNRVLTIDASGQALIVLYSLECESTIIIFHNHNILAENS